jgi:tetratricopeptide (TPR) repeat protein
VSDTIEWSYRLLDETAAALFERLGVFAGPFTAEMVHAVAAPAGADRATSDRTLEELVDVSLVVGELRGDTTRYRLLVTVRRFAFERLSRRGDVEATQDRFVQHVVSQAVATVTAAAGGWDSTMLSRLLDLYEHVVAALRWCLDHDGDGTRSLLLCSLLLGAVDNVHTEEITALVRETLVRWPDPQLRFAAEARSTLATGMLVTGAPDAAMELAEVTLAGLDESSYANVTLPRVIGRAANALGDSARAVEAYTVAAQQARGRGNVGLAMEAETFRALALADMGDVDVAVADLERIAAEAASLGSNVNEAWARTAQGSVLVRRDPAAAATVIDQALASSRRIGFSVGIAASLRSLALVHLAAGELERAAQRLVELLDELTAQGRLSDLHLMFDVAAVVLEQAGTPGWEDLAATARSLPMFSTIVGAGRDLFPPPAGAGIVLSRRDAIVLARRQLAAVRDGGRAGPPGDVGAAGASATLVVRGDYCEIQFAGRTTAAKRSKGLDDLIRLVAAPGREIHCLELIGAGVEQPSTGELIDDTARREYEQRVRDLQAVIDTAEADNDYVRADFARVELDAIVDQLTSTLGLGGRRRRASGSAERARSAVTQRLRATIRRLGETNPALGRHLEVSIITGTYCSYKPEHPVTWQT